MTTLSWVKCGSDWCPFETVDLSNVKTFGVYVIWHQGNPARVVRIGQGDIAARLSSHQRDRQILAYRANGNLKVTWAAVSASQADGVERHLANAWSPLIGDAFPNVTPIAANSPW